MLRYVFIVIFSITFLHYTSAKGSSITDSLLLSLETAGDSKKYDLFLELSDNFQGVDNEKGIDFANRVIIDSLIVTKHQLAKAYHRRGSLLIHIEDTSNGLINLEKAYQIYLTINEDGSLGKELGLICMGQGRAERLLGNNYKSLKIFSAGIDHFRSANDQLGEANCLNHIGIIFSNIHDFESAKEYYLKCQTMYEQLGKNEGRVYILNNLGYLEEEVDNYEEAMDYYNRGLELAREIGFSEMEAHILSNMCNVHFKQNKYAEALKNLEVGLPLSLENESIRLSKFFKLQRAQIELKSNNSNRYFQDVLDIEKFAKTKGFQFLETQALKVLKEFHLFSKNYKGALEVTEILKVQSDSLNNSKLIQETSFLQSKFDYENQQRDKEIKETESNYFKQLLSVLLTFAVLGLCLSLFFLRNMRERNHRINDKNLELRKTEKILDDRNQQLQLYIESNAQLKKFARSTSHDIRSPLRTIGSYADLLRKKKYESLDDDSKVYLDFIRDGASRLYDVTADMLNLATGVGNELYLEKITTVSLVNDVLKDLAFVIEMQKAEVSVGQLPKEIIADKIKVRRIFQNLIENAIKYKHPDKSPEVFISAFEDDEVYKFSIKDNGVGIDPTKVDQIFKVFSRLEKTMEKDGIGIGLSICRNIIEKHGGKIWVNETYKDGAEFCFTLPKEIDIQS